MDEAHRAIALQYAPEEVRAMLAAHGKEFVAAMTTVSDRMSGASPLNERYEAEAVEMVHTGLDGKYLGLTLTEARLIIIRRELAIAEEASRQAKAAQQATAAKRARPINFAAAKRRRLLR